MSSVDMCEHDWPGSGCKHCKIEALSRKVSAPSVPPTVVSSETVQGDALIGDYVRYEDYAEVNK